MNRGTTLKAALLMIPLMGAPAAAKAECPPSNHEEAAIEIVVTFETPAPLPAWGEGDRSDVPASNPVRLLTGMRDPANSMIEPSGLALDQ